MANRQSTGSQPTSHLNSAPTPATFNAPTATNLQGSRESSKTRAGIHHHITPHRTTTPRRRSYIKPTSCRSPTRLLQRPWRSRPPNGAGCTMTASSPHRATGRPTVRIQAPRHTTATAPSRASLSAVVLQAAVLAAGAGTEAPRAGMAMRDDDTAPRHHPRDRHPDPGPDPSLDLDLPRDLPLAPAPAPTPDHGDCVPDPAAPHTHAPPRDPFPAAAAIPARALKAEASPPPLPPSQHPTTNLTPSHRSVPTTAHISSCKVTPAPSPKSAYRPTAGGLPRPRPTAPPKSGMPTRAPTSRHWSATWPACRASPGRPTATRLLPGPTTRASGCGIG